MGTRGSREARFLARVGVRRLDGCEPWLGQVSVRNGGGLFYDDDNRQRSAQVVRWELAHGPLPARTSVTQRCDLATCVRLEHLRVGRGTATRPPTETEPLPPPEPFADPVELSRRARSQAAELRGRSRAAIRHAELLLLRPPDSSTRARYTAQADPGT